MWNRRDVFAAVGAGAAGLALLPGRARAAGQDPTTGGPKTGKGHEHSQMLKECEEACGHCAATCNTTFHHCISLAASGKPEHARVAHVLNDCADFCTLSAAMIARSSQLLLVSCHACAEACALCAKGCEQFPDSDEMKACAESCRRCEKSCREMLKMDHERGLEHPASAR